MHDVDAKGRVRSPLHHLRFCRAPSDSGSRGLSNIRLSSASLSHASRTSALSHSRTATDLWESLSPTRAQTPARSGRDHRCPLNILFVGFTPSLSGRIAATLPASFLQTPLD